MLEYFCRLSLCVLMMTRTIDSTEKFYPFQTTIPKFLPVPTNITVHEGETARLRCRVTNLGTKLMAWRKSTDISPMTVGDVVFTRNKNIELRTEMISDADGEESRYDLIMKDIKRYQAGLYECSLSATENYIQNVTLHVLEPDDFTLEMQLHGTQYLGVTETIHLICNATGLSTAPDGVDWFFNGDLISERNPRWFGRLYKINKKPVPGRSLISEIMIEKATRDDTGHYMCRPLKSRGNRYIADLTVIIINDSKNYNGPRREIGEDTTKAPLHSKDCSSGSSRVNYLSITCITTLCYFITYITYR
ncbi:uncharacterized protein LOC132722149 isoform X8 [Ruditapes philippinarum]|uniref:uncharacterized protein LOC132722149 isoform X8 n=1 Tax=Ruditapes philippinarum TaxID=129788 RepID=UPI00295C2BD7|nr:uncharacterized protein LOC132722149 isoform X8 [Ruditapes philippinarum]